MKKYLFLLISLTLTLVLFGQSNPKIQLAENWLSAQYQYDQLPGISVAVVEDQEIVWSAGFGQLSDHTPTTDETIYSICSISKLFTSISIMQLRDAGKVRLDEPISTYLSWFDLEQQYEASGPITIRSLLTHSSGLPRESNHPYWTGPDFPFPPSESIIAELGKQETLYPASKYFQYSNLGMTLLGEIVKEVSRKSYSDYVNQHILTPLEMRNTRTYMPENLFGTQLAKGKSAKTRAGSRDDVQLFNANGIAPAAGFSSTAIDLAKFAMWQFSVLNGSEKKGILKMSTLEEMQRVHWMDPDWETSWGLGFSVYKSNGKTMVGHGGSCPGYRSTLSIDPKSKRAVIVMINASGTNPGTYARALHKIWAKESPEETDTDLSAYTGTYNSQPWWGEFFVMPWGDQLISFSIPTDSPDDFSKLKHIEGDQFRRIRDNDELGEQILFSRDAAGKVYRMSWHNNHRTKLSVRP